MIIVYFTTNSGNVGRFAEKITKFDTVRIPQSLDEAKNFTVTEEFVLIVPTYMGGNPYDSSAKEPKVRPQIIHFLNNESNRQKLRGVVGSGNTNYGQFFCKSAKIVASKCKVPLLHMFEISGTTEDVKDVEMKVSSLV